MFLCQWFCCERPEGAERRSINLIIRVESQIEGISRQELSAKAADLKMSVNLTRLAAHYFHKLIFRFQSAKVIPCSINEITSAGLIVMKHETQRCSEPLPCSGALQLIQGQTLCHPAAL